MRVVTATSGVSSVVLRNDGLSDVQCRVQFYCVWGNSIKFCNVDVREVDVSIVPKSHQCSVRNAHLSKSRRMAIQSVCHRVESSIRLQLESSQSIRIASGHIHGIGTSTISLACGSDFTLKTFKPICRALVFLCWRHCDSVGVFRSPFHCV